MNTETNLAFAVSQACFVGEGSELSSATPLSRARSEPYRFEDTGGRIDEGRKLCPIPRWPWYRDDGALIIPDGRRFLDVDQAATASDLSPSSLRIRWRDRMDDCFPGVLKLLDALDFLQDREPVQLTLARLEVKLGALAELTADVAELRALLETTKGGVDVARH